MFGDGLSHRVRIRSGSVEVWLTVWGMAVSARKCISLMRHVLMRRSAHRVFFLRTSMVPVLPIWCLRFPVAWKSIATNPEMHSHQLCRGHRLAAPFTALSQLRFIDLLGEGTSALVFTSAGPQMTHYYFNFCGEREAGTPALKPYLLTRIDNNLGATTEIFYTSSTQFYLEDKLRGTPWATRLPFPVQVVAKTIVTDAITASQMTQIYRYHEGYFDADAREFNGFGFVESWDSEQLAVNREGESRDRDVPRSIPAAGITLEPVSKMPPLLASINRRISRRCSCL
jgi:hypothetical protein